MSAVTAPGRGAACSVCCANEWSCHQGPGGSGVRCQIPQDSNPEHVQGGGGERAEAWGDLFFGLMGRSIGSETPASGLEGGRFTRDAGLGQRPSMCPQQAGPRPGSQSPRPGPVLGPGCLPQGE